MIVILVGRVFANNQSTPPESRVYCRAVSCNCSPSYCDTYDECNKQWGNTELANGCNRLLTN